MFKAQITLCGQRKGFSHWGYVFIIALFLLIFSRNAGAQDLIINIDDITVNPADSVFEIPVYLENLTTTLCGFAVFIRIDAPHIINFDTLDFIAEEGEIIANWGVIAGGISDITLAYLVGGTIHGEDFIEPFSGQKLLFKLKGVFASVNPGVLCDSSGAIAANAAASSFSDPYGNTLTFEVNQGSYHVTCSACGDANLDDAVNVSDAVQIINYVFIGGNRPADLRDGDTNCDGTCNVSDAVWLINYIFIGGNAPCDSDGDTNSDC